VQTTPAETSGGDIQPYVNGQPATSYDYLEKIFQIPFVLKPMDATGKSNLIKSQLEKKKDLKTEVSKTTAVASTGTGENIVGTSSTNVVPHVADGSMPAPTPTAQDTVSLETKTAKSDLLEISDDEICFMQNIGFLIGNSPRTIKRYTNIYRIIRTHSKYEFLDNNELSHYCASMILLAIITGLPSEAKSFFEKVEDAPDDLPLKTWLSEYLSASKKPNALLVALQSKLDKKEFKPIQNVTLDKFKKNLDLAGRFSFRSLTAQPEEEVVGE